MDAHFLLIYRPTWLRLPFPLLFLHPHPTRFSFSHISRLLRATRFSLQLISILDSNELSPLSLYFPCPSPAGRFCSDLCLADVPYPPPVQRRAGSHGNYSANIRPGGHIPAASLRWLLSAQIPLGNSGGVTNGVGKSDGLHMAMI